MLNSNTKWIIGTAIALAGFLYWQVDGVNSRIDDTNSRIDGTNSRIDAVRSDVNGIREDIRALNGRIDAVLLRDSERTND